VGLIFIRKSKVFTKFERALTYRYVVYWFIYFILFTRFTVLKVVLFHI
jgi:hypothetical protein